MNLNTIFLPLRQAQNKCAPCSMKKTERIILVRAPPPPQEKREGSRPLDSMIQLLFSCMETSLNPVPNAQVCVYLTVHITKLQLQTTFPKPLYIPHSACIHPDLGH